MADEQEYEGSYDEYQDGLAAQAEHEREEHNKWVDELKDGIETPELRAFIDRLKESQL